MQVTPLKLQGAILFEPLVHQDHRGFFMESYNAKKFLEAGLKGSFVQDNHSLSHQPGVLRGLHYQIPPKAQAKLIRVISGAVYDVILDLRQESETFGEWTGIILSEHNHRQLFVPKGFAHGFCTLTENTQVIYKVDEYYSPEHEYGIAWNDPTLAIDWPFANPVLSDKDKLHPSFEEVQNDLRKIFK